MMTTLGAPSRRVGGSGHHGSDVANTLPTRPPKPAYGASGSRSGGVSSSVTARSVENGRDDNGPMSSSDALRELTELARSDAAVRTDRDEIEGHVSPWRGPRG